MEQFCKRLKNMENKSFILSMIVIAVIGLVLIIIKVIDRPEPITDTGGLITITPRIWTDPDNPMQSGYLEKSEVPEDAIRITATAQGFEPDSFEVKKGKKIALAVNSGDEWSHVFKFQDESLSKVGVAVGTGKTSAITFYAPKEAGEYAFYCDIKGHISRGETGKMIVK